jgi:glycerophosphoryl diester phosphodiesterase
VAHRGHRACFPENTMAAFADSLGRCGMIELDVRLSKDGVAMVCHDHQLVRTTDAVLMAAELGLASLAVVDWRLDQLRRLDTGAWFLRHDPFGTLASGIADRGQVLASLPLRIPTLREVLAWAVVHRMPLNIELKDMEQPLVNERLATTVIREVAAARADALVLLSSFNHPMLRLCRSLAPTIALAVLQEGEHPPDPIDYLRALEACAYHLADTLVDFAILRAMRSAGIHVNVFTVNDPVRQRQLFGAGVTGVFTDFLPDKQTVSPSE